MLRATKAYCIKFNSKLFGIPGRFLLAVSYFGISNSYSFQTIETVHGKQKTSLESKQEGSHSNEYN